MRFPRFARRRQIIAAALIGVALISIVIYQRVRIADAAKLAADRASGLEVKRGKVLNGTGELLAWNPMGAILVTYTDDMTDEYQNEGQAPQRRQFRS
jgi:hypothetical protein